MIGPNRGIQASKNKGKACKKRGPSIQSETNGTQNGSSNRPISLYTS